MRKNGLTRKHLSGEVNRREFLKKVGISAAAISTLSSLNFTAECKERKKLILIGHRVHQTVAGGGEGKGKNLIKLFEQKYDTDIIYHTYTPSEVREKIFRIGPLSRTEEDIFHIQPFWAIPVLTKFLEPLDSYLKNKPIEGWPEDWPKPMIESAILEGKIYMIPVRAGCFGMWYNRRVFNERGVGFPLKTAEELYDTAKACTFERPDGEKIYGWSMRTTIGELFEPLVGMIRMWGENAHLITPDFKVTLTDPPVLQTVSLLQKMFNEGIIPPDMSTYSYAENIKMFQQGRVAMTIEAMNYWPTFNDPKASKIAGEAIPGLMPISKNLKHIRDFSTSFMFLWYLGILRGSQRKDLAWEYIRHLSTRESHLEMAKSGNPPPRLSVLGDPEYIKIDPGAKITKKQIEVALQSIPAFPNVSRALDIIGEHVHEVVFHGKSPEDEMKKATEKIKPLLP